MGESLIPDNIASSAQTSFHGFCVPLKKNSFLEMITALLTLTIIIILRTKVVTGSPVSLQTSSTNVPASKWNTTYGGNNYSSRSHLVGLNGTTANTGYMAAPMYDALPHREKKSPKVEEGKLFSTRAVYRSYSSFSTYANF